MNGEQKPNHAFARSLSNAGLCAGGYWCVVCGRYLPADEDGVIVHDSVPHPEDMTFNEEDRPQ